jgi:putative protein kinase ArgK-like GTPase of G3E family
VLNKLDMVPAEERAARVKDFVKRLRWKGPVHEISALAREGLEPLVRAMYHVAEQPESAGRSGSIRVSMRPRWWILLLRWIPMADPFERQITCCRSRRSHE